MIKINLIKNRMVWDIRPSPRDHINVTVRREGRLVPLPLGLILMQMAGKL